MGMQVELKRKWKSGKKITRLKKKKTKRKR